MHNNRPGRSAHAPFLFAIALTLACHGIGWVAWFLQHQTVASDDWKESRNHVHTPSVVRIQLRTRPGDLSPLASRTAHDTTDHAALFTGMAHVGSPQSSATFVPSSALDIPVVPMSAPDTRRLDGLNFSGQVIRLRLYIDTTGRVLEIQTLQGAQEDASAIDEIKAMLADTAYIPGRLHGKIVPTQLDLELQISSAE